MGSPLLVVLYAPESQAHGPPTYLLSLSRAWQYVNQVIGLMPVEVAQSIDIEPSKKSKALRSSAAT